MDARHPEVADALKPAYRYVTSGAADLVRAATTAGRRFRDVRRRHGEG